ncbi:mycothiol synthase [Oryzobacter telluris]|uniref:mycothiol synthase n=1 Tax=Oryzobacter telluris TaxID=3149179 RepID=UPI00370D2F0F
MGRTERVLAVDAETTERLRSLWSRAQDADGVGAVSEAFRMAVGPARDGVVHLLAMDDGGDLVGYAQVAAAGTDDAVAELVVDPDHRRRGHGRALLDAALGEGTRSVWSHGLLPAAEALASSAGLTLTRSLHRMARPLTDDDRADPALPQGFSVRPFVPGPDDEAWVTLNAAAFASHPEQGRLTVADLRERMAQPWFDAAGFLLLEDDAAGRVVAFHWTKVEPDATPGQADGGRTDDVRHGSGRAHGSGTDDVRHGTGRGPGANADEVREGVGEVYVVGVDPTYQGRGLGGPLTALGLAHLARLGLAEVDLYVDGDNTAARRTYQRLGFVDTSVDGQYSVPPTSSD